MAARQSLARKGGGATHAPPLEIDIQLAFRRTLRMVAPRVRAVAVPNAAKRTQWAAGQAKKEGMASGFPDMICMAPGGLFAAIEFKALKGKTSDNQADWLDWLTLNGFHCTVARSAEEAVEFLRGAGFPVMGRVGA